jgi:hypothetical protein
MRIVAGGGAPSKCAGALYLQPRFGAQHRFRRRVWNRKAEPGALGIDRSPGPDFVWDLDHYPWPLEADGFERIHMSHIIEHVQDVMAMMAEVPGRQFENGGGVARSSGVGCDGG